MDDRFAEFFADRDTPIEELYDLGLEALGAGGGE